VRSIAPNRGPSHPPLALARRASALRSLALHAIGTLALLLGAPGAAQGIPAAPVASGPTETRTLDALVAAHPVFGPALAFRSLATTAADRALDAAEAELRRTDHGLSAELVWRPGVRWRSTGDALGDATWSSELTASFGWRSDAAAIVRARIALHRAAVARTERHNRDLRDVVARHIELQRAWIARTIAESAAADRAATLADAERVDLPALVSADGGVDASAPEPRTLLASRLDAERAVAAVERSGREVAEAERRAAAVGLDPAIAADLHRDRFTSLALEGWRLWLPAADPLAAPAATRAALDLAVAEATARRSRIGGIVDDLRIDAVRIERDARLRTTLRLDDGRPAAGFDLTLRPATRASWSVGWSAVLRLDDRLVRDLERADAAVAEAAAAWAEAADEAGRTLASARQAALDAEEDVAFAERGLALSRLGLREALATWRERDTESSAARARADAALARAAIALERERDAFYRAWNRYLLEAERYWSAAGAFGGVIAPP